MDNENGLAQASAIYIVVIGVATLLFCGLVSAAGSSVGGESLSFLCTDDGNTRKCSCKPPKTSSDCRRLLARCDSTSVDVKDWYDDLGHLHTVQRIPDVKCTDTECVCEWTKNISSQSGGKVELQDQLVAPPGPIVHDQRRPKIDSNSNNEAEIIAPNNRTGTERVMRKRPSSSTAVNGGRRR